MIPNPRGRRGPQIIRYLPILLAIVFFVVVGVRAGCQSASVLPEYDVGSEELPAPEAAPPGEEAAKAREDTSTDSDGNPRDTSSDNELRAHFIDVGQGDAILLTAESANILIDGGSRSAGDALVDYLRKLGIERLDLVVASHPHEDHIGGLLAVFEHFPVDTVLDAGVPHTTATFDRYLTRLERMVGEDGTQYLTPEGQTLRFGDVTVEVLGPRFAYDSLNDNSVVCRVGFRRTSFLFTGDMERETESDLLGSGENVEADVLKVSHHGSRSSTSEEFLRGVSPAHAVICVGEDNSYGHPADEVLERLSEYGVRVHRTDSSGTLLFISDGESILSPDATRGTRSYEDIIARLKEWIGATIPTSLINPSRR
ncbi:MAG: ComEC/Rec2 family competence protein [Bacillota bacterium]